MERAISENTLGILRPNLSAEWWMSYTVRGLLPCFSSVHIYTSTITSSSPGYQRTGHCDTVRLYGIWQLSPDNQFQDDKVSSEVLIVAKSNNSSKNHRPGEVESRRVNMGREER